MNSLTDAQLTKIVDPEHGWKFGFTRQMAAELLMLRRVAVRAVCPSCRGRTRALLATERGIGGTYHMPAAVSTWRDCRDSFHDALERLADGQRTEANKQSSEGETHEPAE